MTDLAVGVDLGGTAVKVGLVDRGGEILKSIHLETDAKLGPSHVLKEIIEGIRSVLESNSDPCAVGIGAPGSVTLDHTTVIQPPNFPGWQTVNLSDEVGTALGGRWPVVVDNDANVAALGSAHYGAGQAFDSFIMITLGTGVGGAIIHEKKLFRGTTGAAGEIGHVSIDYDGPMAAAGIPGVIEAYLGQRFLSEHARRRLKAYPDSLVFELVGGEPDELTPKTLSEAARKGDTAATEILAWAGHKLGWGLGSVVNVLDIRKIVVGGGVSAAGDLILGPARTALMQAVMPGMRQGVELVRETLGNQAGMLGAARLAFDHAG
jgi:glucokinase